MALPALASIGWGMSTEIAAACGLMVADVSSFCSANNPSFFTFRAFSTAGGNKAEDADEDMKIGIAKAALETVVLGLALAAIFHSWWILLAGLFYLVFTALFYRWALAHPHEAPDEIAAQ
ncbi:MAG: hypothetical protein ABSC73_09410 [Acidimicrobiales bacterium]|jgi:hypothetical protein